MRILITIPHFFRARSEEARHASHRGSARGIRAQALELSLVQLHALFSRQRVFAVSHIAKAFEQVPPTGHQLDVVIVTVPEHHLLQDIQVPGDMYHHHVVTDIDPMYLGFECHNLIKASLGQYDYYAYMEDDLVIHDPAFFDKLEFFNKASGQPSRLLQPHRYEIAVGEPADKKALAHKVYNDYRGGNHTYPDPPFTFNALGRPITIERSTQPHAGCWFLNEAQARRFAGGGFFGWCGELLWNSPLDTAATWGLVRSFAIYKAALDSLDFFELQHVCPIVMKQVYPSDGPIPAWVW